MHGKQMKEGQQILVLYPSANRDERIFDNPYTFDVKREFRRPALSFGYGKHFCLGAALARLEMRIFLEETLKRLPDIRLHDSKEATLNPSCFIRGLKHLPVQFSA